MSTRTIENPGIEINEIDRSQYDKVDYSLQNAPKILTMGYASQGEDLALTWINSKATLDDVYGKPTNEYESYFYNSMYEILRRGGTCIASKLPYDNGSYNCYNYVEYTIGNIVSFITNLSDDANPSPPYNTIQEIHDGLSNVLMHLREDLPYDTIIEMKSTIEQIYSEYVEAESTIDQDMINTIRNIRDCLEKFIEKVVVSSNFATLELNDTNLTSYIPIEYSTCEKDRIENLDRLLTNEANVRPNKIRIYDMTRTQYKQLNQYDGCVLCGNVELSTIATNDCLGIVPVIVTPANALFFQNMLNFNAVKNCDYTAFNQVSSFKTVDGIPDISCDFKDIESHLVIPIASVPPVSSYSTGSDYVSLSRNASVTFPTINYNGPSHFDTTNLKNIGVVVFKAYADLNNNGKLNFELLESFVGSLLKTAKDPLTNANIFIDTIVNSQSQYIRLFSNANQDDIEKTSTIGMSKQPAVSLGFYKTDCKKLISYSMSIVSSLSRLLANASNPNTLPLDIVVDGGMSNIAQLAYVSKNKMIDADIYPNVASNKWRLGTSGNDISGWKTILQKFDNFAKYTRKDCMFIADGIRSMCLDGNVKYVRKTCPENTVTNTIMPKFKYMTNALNSSYSAGYCNWYYQYDYGTDSTSYIWIPPSIKAAGVYIYCDTYFHPWSAPAGQVRGILDDVFDVAFIPLDSDAGQIYSNQWNYAMSYPLDGIVVEGHKTFQTQKTALDRINVRRLMLDLEKKIARIARRFVYEGNTSYLRQSFVDSARVVLEDAVAGDGIKEYAIKCDEELNTPEVIENNEMRCKIAIKPVKVVDFIVVDFVVTRQSANVSEEVLR